MLTQVPSSLRDRLFFLILKEDVELAETFLNRCPDTDDVAELNRFFRTVFSQLNMNTRDVRALLDDTMSPETWLQCFLVDVMPILRTWRFPPDTSKKAVSFYGRG